MRKVFAAVLPVFLCALNAAAQATPNRVTGPVDEKQRVTLRGNVHPLAQARFDRGAAPGSTPTGRLRLVLERSAAQQQALTEFLADVQNPASGVYHKWLTPAQYGANFGISGSDLSRVTGWLEANGFKIERIPAARNVIEFSGNFSQVESAFHAAIHTFSVNGETHFANSVEPQIPAALAPVIAGVGPLNDFRPKSMMVEGPRGRFDPGTGRIEPDLTLKFGNTDYLFVDPADAATIYDTPNKVLNTAYTGATTYDGSGVNLGIVGVSDLTLADVANYRTAFLGETSSTVNLPTVVVDGGDPGLNGAAIEALLDNEVAGGIAPKAKIYFYTSADTDLSSGLWSAFLRALDDNVVSILSMSFGECEAGLGTSGNQFVLEVEEQAAAQGITVTVSSGDNGSAGCDNFDTQSTATEGLAVSGFASTPYNIAVGGTDYDVLKGSFSTYVSTTSSGSAPYYRTALKYIPEEPWNDSTTVNGTYENNVAATSGGVGNIVAGSGGVSKVYSKPAFQTLLTPQDKFRDLPDVSLLAANGLYGAVWVVCADSSSYGIVSTSFTDCQTTNGQFTSSTSFSGVGGTSASAPAFAGMMALVAQAHGSASDNYRLGQADNVLYQLAHSKYSAVFHDITTGNNSVACSPGSLNCGSNSFITGYNAGSGYDLATGLGSVDVAAMVSNWTTVSPAATTTTLKINGSTADYTGVHGAALNFGVSVNPATATGVVGLVDNANETAGGNQNNGQLPIPIASGAGSASYNGLPGGSYTVWARYGGDTNNAASSSAPPIHVTISPEPSTIQETVTAFDWETGQVLSLSNIPYGSVMFIDGQITGTAEGNNTQGVATGTVTFKDGTGTLGSSGVNSGNLASLIFVGTMPGGAHSVVANYPGDPSYSKSASTPVAFTVLPLATTLQSQATMLTVTPPAQSTTIISTGYAAWTPGSPPTGTVSVNLGSTVLGSTSSFIISSGINGTGLYVSFLATVTLDTSKLAPGVNSLVVSYSGDTNYLPSTTSIQIDNVAAGGGPVINLPETLLAGAGANAIFPLSLSSTGNYTGFMTWGCDPVPATSPSSCMSYGSLVPLSGSVDAVLQVSANTNTAGTYTASLMGDDNSAPGIHPTQNVSIVVNAAATPTLALFNDGTLNVAPGSSAANTSNVTIVPNGGLTGQVNLTCTVTTAIANPQNLPSCTVPASITLSGTSPVIASVQVSTASGTTPGNYAVAVTANSASSSGVTATNAVPLMVTTARSFALTSGAGTLTISAGAITGNTVAITVTPLNGFSGQVNLTCLAVQAQLSGTPAPNATVAQCSMPASVAISGGSPTAVNATVTPDSNTAQGFYVMYVSATDATTGTFGIANAIDLLVAGSPAFTLSPQGAISITAGATTGNTSAISVTPTNGFTGAINLTCTVKANGFSPTAAPSCSLSPTAVTVSSSGTAQGSTLTVTTTANTGGAAVPGARPFRLAGAAATLAIVVLFGMAGKRRSWMRLPGLLVLLLWIAAPGCGGGGGSGGGGGGGGGGTTTGSYTVTVTGTDAATGRITAQTSVSLTVN